VANTAARLQSVAAGGELVVSEAVARIAGVEEGEVVTLDRDRSADNSTRWSASWREPTPRVSAAFRRQPIRARSPAVRGSLG
jgi:class 3 adenylate cyclase